MCFSWVYSRKYGNECDFLEKGKNMWKKSKKIENLGKYVQNLKTFWKRADD